jgi:hypothetical protein
MKEGGCEQTVQTGGEEGDVRVPKVVLQDGDGFRERLLVVKTGASEALDEPESAPTGRENDEVSNI